MGQREINKDGQDRQYRNKEKWVEEDGSFSVTLSPFTLLFKPQKLPDANIYQRDYILDELRCCLFDKLRLASIEIYRLYLLDHDEAC